MIGWSSNPRIPNRHAWHKRLVTGFEVSFVLRMEKDISLIPLQAIVCSLFRIEDWSQNSHTAREIMSIMCIFYSASSSQKKNAVKRRILPQCTLYLSPRNITRLYKCSLFGWRNSASVLQMFSSANQPTSINLDSSISACRKIDENWWKGSWFLTPSSFHILSSCHPAWRFKASQTMKPNPFSWL